MIPFILVMLGLLLILFEFYLPGGVLGVLGGVAIFIAIVLFASQTSSILSLVLFIIGTAVALTLLIRFALWRIVNAKPADSIYSSANQEGYQASSYDTTAIGKQGVVITDLKPGGYILVEGCQQPAISTSGYLVKGDQVLVIGGQEQSLIVKQVKKGQSL
ncbi:MAG: NfeD family protein [Parachlamydiaceae bacterium]